MNLIVIDCEDSWHVADLRRAAGNTQCVSACNYKSVCASISGTSDNSTFLIGGIDIRDVDCILTRAMPASSLEQVVFRMDWLAQLQQQTNVLVINPAKTIEASVDKYLSLELIRRQGITVPKTFVSQTAELALKHFAELNCDSVVKPLFGSGGRRIVRLKDRKLAEEHFAKSVVAQEVIYQQQYIEHGDSDLRLLTIGDEVFGMRRQRTGEWIVNAQLGAVCTTHEPDELEKGIAQHSALAVNALISGVDLVYNEHGSPLVVEINSCPSWKAISQATGIDISKTILNFVERKLSR